MIKFSLNIRGKIMEYTHPVVMGILNITPDSFYADSRAMDADDIKRKVEVMIADGVDIIDIGACSTRPGSQPVDHDVECARLALGMQALRAVAPDIVVSVDTFNASVAKEAVTNLGADIINDISGGRFDPEMFPTVAALKVPYVLTHSRGEVMTMHQYTDYTDVTAEVLSELSFRLAELHLLGVSDVIIDPGFGFSKTPDQCYQLLRDLSVFTTLSCPMLVGVSRKSMITKLLGISAEDAGNATTVINTLALERGASILRVHNVKAAREAVKICELS